MRTKFLSAVIFSVLSWKMAYGRPFDDVVVFHIYSSHAEEILESYEPSKKNALIKTVNHMTQIANRVNDLKKRTFDDALMMVKLIKLIPNPSDEENDVLKAFVKLHQQHQNATSEIADSFEVIKTPVNSKISNYQYTSIDVSRILSRVQNSSEFFTLDGEEVLGHRIYRRGNQYLLPPITGHASQDPYVELAEYVNGFFHHPTIAIHVPTEMIIPFNPGGHWVTLWVRINDENLSIDYIDSLGAGPKVSTQLIGLVDELGRKFPERVINTPVACRPRSQIDGVSCGVIMVENIFSLFGRGDLPNGEVMDSAKILTIRRRHLAFLKENNWDLDFNA